MRCNAIVTCCLLKTSWEEEVENGEEAEEEEGEVKEQREESEQSFLSSTGCKWWSSNTSGIRTSQRRGLLTLCHMTIPLTSSLLKKVGLIGKCQLIKGYTTDLSVSPPEP